jgi:hypothetical protein
MEATKSGVLQINGDTVNNAGGHITANGGTVQLFGSAVIQGGTLNTLSGGTLGTPANNVATLDGTTKGALTLSAGSTYTSGLNTQTTLLGTITNKGKIQLNGGSATNTLLLIGNNVALNGGGTLTLSTTPAGGGSTFIQQSVSGLTLTNTNDTIQGAGVIGNGGLKLVNGGTLFANASGQTLLINGSGGLTNNGTMKVNAGGMMQVTSPFTNFSGNTLTGGNYIVNGAGPSSPGTLQINAFGTTGGEVVNNAASITLSGLNSSIIDQSGLDALRKLAANSTSTSSFTVTGGRNFTTVANFTNHGTLTVGSGSKFIVPTGKSLTNFSGTTLTGGAYNVTGTLQFPGANIVTNAANITLSGTSSQMINQSSANGLAKFATNAGNGKFTVASGRVFITGGPFTNDGSLALTGSGSKFTTGGKFTNTSLLTIGSSTAFTVGGTGLFTQTAGTTTDDGTLTLPASGTLNLNGGSLFGGGTITGAMKSSGIVSPGDSEAATGILKDMGAYTQNSTGVLDIAIGGTTAGTQYDQLNPSTASLGGTLNISRSTGFVPRVGSTFKILNFNSATGKFAKVTGLGINSTEHFTITYQPKDVLLTVVSGAAPIVGQFTSSNSVGASYGAGEIARFGLYGRIGWSNSPRLIPRVFAAGPLGSPLVSEWASGSRIHADALLGTTHSRSMVDGAAPFRPAPRSLVGLDARASIYLGREVMSAAKLASMDYAARQNTLNRIEVFFPAPNSSVGRAPYSIVSSRATGTIRYRVNPAAAAVRNNGRTPRMMVPKSMEYHLDVLSLLGTSRRQALRGLLGQPGNPTAAGLGYFTFSGIR